ncbi:MAG: hypothetical protein J6D42_05825 [Clostridia bacterium]|nr:hypothetical protein [Clostridia bacterium]
MKNYMIAKQENEKRRLKRILRVATAIVCACGIGILTPSVMVYAYLSRINALIAGEEVFFFAMIAVGLGLLGIGFVFGGDDL